MRSLIVLVTVLFALVGAAAALAQGGHVRVGVGDNPIAARGRSNQELVAEAVSLAAEYGRAPARPADVLRMCGIRPRA